jgi:hypothetical protein
MICASPRTRKYERHVKSKGMTGKTEYVFAGAMPILRGSDVCFELD